MGLLKSVGRLKAAYSGNQHVRTDSLWAQYGGASSHFLVELCPVKGSVVEREGRVEDPRLGGERACIDGDTEDVGSDGRRESDVLRQPDEPARNQKGFPRQNYRYSTLQRRLTLRCLDGEPSSSS